MSIIVKKIKPEFIDKRGIITRILDQNKISIRSVLLITSKSKTVRGEHYHKKDSHYVYCLKGKLKYSARDMRKKVSHAESVILNEGDLVLTPPMTWHSMEFLEDSVFFAFTTETRAHNKYEADTVRSKGNQKDEQ